MSSTLRQRRNARICDNNQLDSAVITAPFAVGFPFSNALDAKRRGLVWKPGTKTMTLEFDLNSNKQCSFLALFGEADKYLGISDQAIITLKGNMIDLFTGGEPFSITVPVTDGGIFADLTDEDNPTGQQYRYWQLYIDDSTNPEDLALSYVYLGDHINMQFNAKQNFEFSKTDLTRRATSDSGVVYSIRKNQYCLFSAMGFSYVGTDDRRKLQSTTETLGLATPFIFVLDPLQIAYEFDFGTLLCYFQEGLPKFTQAYLNKFNISFALREVV